MKKLVKLTAVAGAVTAIALALTAVPKVAQAVDLCGATVTGNVILLHDHDCSGGDGLIIGDDGITVDLGGFDLKGNTTGKGIDNTGGFNGVTIMNGVIDGFDQGVRGVGVSGFALEDLTFTGQTSSHSIDILDSERVSITDTTFSIAPAFLGPEAIRLESVGSVKVQRVHVVGGFVGVNFACGACDGSEPPTNGIVRDSTFSGTLDNAVLLANTTNARILGNVISVAGFAAIQIGFGSLAAPATGAKVFDNVITGTIGEGIQVRTSGNKLKGNIVTDSDGDGIVLRVGTSGNTVEDNVSNVNAGFGYVELGANTFTGNECKANTLGGSDPTLGSLCAPQP